MMEIACQCRVGGVVLPPHDHRVGFGMDGRGIYGPVYDFNDVGRVWVDWKEVAHALLVDQG